MYEYHDVVEEIVIVHSPIPQVSKLNDSVNALIMLGVIPILNGICCFQLSSICILVPYMTILAPPRISTWGAYSGTNTSYLEVDIDKHLCRNYCLPCPSSLLVQKLD